MWYKNIAGRFFGLVTKAREKSAAKFHYIKTVSSKVVARSIAFRVVSIYIGRGTTPSPPEILAQTDPPLSEGSEF